MALSDRLTQMKNNQMLNNLTQQQNANAGVPMPPSGPPMPQPGTGGPPMPPNQPPPMPPSPMSPSEGLSAIPEDPPITFNKLLKDVATKIATPSLVDRATPPHIKRKLEEIEEIEQEEENQLALQEKASEENLIMAAMQKMAADQNLAMKSGGLIGMAGGGFMGQVPGEGHGMEDNVYMPIVQREAGKQVGTLAVSPDEYVVDAHTMSALGNGSADAGAKVMDQVVKGVRQKAFGTDQQPQEINGLAALRPMIERV
jgi:hypothetical protein